MRFFKLMGTALAFLERTPIVPDTPANRKDLSAELREYATRLDVENCLQGYGAALQILGNPDVKGVHYFLVELDAEQKQTKITGYSQQQLDKASQDYLEAERKITFEGSNAVLVSVDSIAALRRAYPSYFLDTTYFLRSVKRVLAE